MSRDGIEPSIRRLRLIVAFAVCQGIGAIGFLFWEWVNTPALLVASWVLLFPGNVIASNIVSATLWGARLSLQTLSVCSMLLAVASNAAVWIGIASLGRRLVFNQRGPSDAQ